MASSDCRTRRQRSLVGQTMLILQNLWQVNLSLNASTLYLTIIGPGIGLMYEFSPNVSVFVLTGKIIGRLKLQVLCRAVPNVVHGPLCIRIVSSLTISPVLVPSKRLNSLNVSEGVLVSSAVSTTVHAFARFSIMITV